MNAKDKLNQALDDRVYRFSDGTISNYRTFFNSHPPINKVTYISNHTEHRIHLTYEPTKDKYSYTLYYTDNAGIDVPKIVYEFYDVPARISDQRF